MPGKQFWSTRGGTDRWEYPDVVIPYKGGTARVYLPTMLSSEYEKAGRDVLEGGEGVLTGEPLAALVSAVVTGSARGTNAEALRMVISKDMPIYAQCKWVREGVYVVQDPQALGARLPLRRRQLERALASGSEKDGVRSSPDGHVRFVHRDAMSPELYSHDARAYPGTVLDAEELEKEAFVRGLHGEEGALLLGAAARRLQEEFRNQSTLQIPGDAQSIAPGKSFRSTAFTGLGCCGHGCFHCSAAIGIDARFVHHRQRSPTAYPIGFTVEGGAPERV